MQFAINPFIQRNQVFQFNFMSIHTLDPDFYPISFSDEARAIAKNPLYPMKMVSKVSEFQRLSSHVDWKIEFGFFTKIKC